VPVLALALSLLLAAPPAANEPSADRVRYQRQSTSSPRVRADALDRKLEWAKRTQAREAEQMFRSGSHFRVCRACVEPEMRAKQIEFLRNLVETTAEDDPEYPDYLFRLADHYLEQKVHYEEQAIRLQEQIDELEASVAAEAFELEP
jgi:hypothetical protein